MIQYTFWNTCDIGDILFSTGFKPTFYLNQEMGYPQYPVIKEQEKDGDQNEIDLWSKLQKRYSLTILCDEPTLDGLTISQICDNVWITNPVTEMQYKIKDIVFDDVAWNEEDGLATVKISFAVSEFIKSNCC